MPTGRAAREVDVTCRRPFARPAVTGFAELSRAAAAATEARPRVPLALATLVDVDGSSYRQPGARLLIDAEGRVLAGSVSGGCLEGDIAARAADVCASGQSVRLRYDLRADLETIWGFGAACDGVAHLLLEPLPDWQWLADAEAIRLRRAGGSIAVLLTPSGGRTALLLEGDPAGGGWQEIGGGGESMVRDVPMELVTEAALVARRTGYVEVAVSSDGGATAFVEPLIAPVALHVIGASRGAEAFAIIAQTMGWQVTIIDHRPALLDALHLPAGVCTLPVRHADALDAMLSALPADGRTAIALLTHIFDVDVAWLTALLPLPIAYIGVLGSRQRAQRLVDDAEARLTARGARVHARMKQRVHAPIGLDLGGEDPAAIALAAIAEIEAVMHARPGGYLRERQAPIHARFGRAAHDGETAVTPDRCDLPPE